MSDTARKAVVTTAQVRDAFASYASALVLVGQPEVAGNEFDKGLRGRGFAEYDAAGNVVRTFETKDDALNFYGLSAAAMWVVLDYVQKNVVADESEATPEVPAKTTRKAADKPAS